MEDELPLRWPRFESGREKSKPRRVTTLPQRYRAPRVAAGDSVQDSDATTIYA